MTVLGTINTGSNIVKVGRELIEEITMGSAVISHDFTAVLDGNNDGGYIMESRIVNNNASLVGYFMRVNGDAIVGNRQYVIDSATSITGNRDTAINFTAAVGSASTNNSEATVEMRFSKTGQPRYFRGVSDRDETTSLSRLDTTINMTTPPSGTNITSMGVGADSASGLGVGTTLRLYKLIT